MSPGRDEDGIVMHFKQNKVNIVITNNHICNPALVTGERVRYKL